MYTSCLHALGKPSRGSSKHVTEIPSRFLRKNIRNGLERGLNITSSGIDLIELRPRLQNPHIIGVDVTDPAVIAAEEASGHRRLLMEEAQTRGLGAASSTVKICTTSTTTTVSVTAVADGADGGGTTTSVSAVSDAVDEDDVTADPAGGSTTTSDPNATTETEPSTTSTSTTTVCLGGNAALNCATCAANASPGVGADGTACVCDAGRYWDSAVPQYHCR